MKHNLVYDSESPEYLGPHHNVDRKHAMSFEKDSIIYGSRLAVSKRGEFDHYHVEDSQEDTDDLPLNNEITNRGT